MDRKYVFNPEQFVEALVRGGLEMGIIERGDAEAALAIFAEGAVGASLDVAENGCMVTTHGNVVAPTRDAFGPGAHVPAPASPGAEPSSEPASPPSKARRAPAAISAEDVKKHLVVVMVRPPTVAQIRTWSQRERLLALDWAKDKAAGNGEAPPEHVKERAPRKSRNTGSGTGGSTETGGGQSESGGDESASTPDDRQKSFWEEEDE
jgi:hypothetical protein